MFSKIELKQAYGLAICFMFVGVLCYAAFPAKTPAEPVRLMFNVTAGKVLFDHKIHHADTGYGISCGDLVHHKSVHFAQLIGHRLLETGEIGARQFVRRHHRRLVDNLRCCPSGDRGK